MKQRIINPQFQAIRETADVLKIYISTELDTETLVFRVDVTDFEDDEYEYLRSTMSAVCEIENEHLLTIITANCETTVCFFFYHYFIIVILTKFY